MDIAPLTRLDPSRDLMADRAAEVAEYFGITADEAVAMYQAYNLRRTRRVPAFASDSLEALMASYVQPARLEAELSRLMLHYTRLDMAGTLLDALLALYPTSSERAGVRVVDYGCGAADFGLAFALMGFHVTLVDIGGGKVEFGSWRLRRRGLPHEVIAISPELEYADLEGADLVMAGDLLEHLRDPREMIRRVADGLRPGGHFWFPDFPFKEKPVGTQHLESAADLRAESAELVRARFQRVGPIKHLMKLRPRPGGDAPGRV